MQLITDKLTLDDVKQIAAGIGIQIYESRNNGIATKGRHEGKLRMTFSLRPLTREFYRVNSHTGRRIWAVCWHGHYKFLDNIFARDPDACVKSGLDVTVIYNGRAEFLTLAPDTYYSQIGSQMYPRVIGEDCECV
jgi:hypothetical protein